MSWPFGSPTGEPELPDQGRFDAFDNPHYGPEPRLRTADGSTVG